MKIDVPWLTSEQTQAVLGMLIADGGQAYAVGGCVRNTLLGEPVSDIDISTSLRPEVVMARAKASGMAAIPTGIEHGTVTLVVDDHPFEVTTFRKDVETDGRRAVVAFTDSVEDDARRRDFTMNALYADARGQVIDPLGGLPDLQSRYVRFIENPEDRIREDYLRILRFFRFFAWYGSDTDGPDPEGLAACAALSDGLTGISAERIGAELLKLLSAPDPARAVGSMARSGVLAQVLPGADPRFLFPLVSHAKPDCILRLASLGGEDASKRLRLSKAQSARLDRLRDAAMGGAGPSELGYRLGEEDATAALQLRAAFLEQPPSAPALQAAQFAAKQVFPVKAKDLMPGLEGAALGARLRALETAWIASGFTLSKADLIRL